MRHTHRICLVLALLLTVQSRPAMADGFTLDPPLQGRVLETFSDGTSRYSSGHRGVDIAARPGDQVRAGADGVVSFAGWVVGRPSVSIDHGNGLRTTHTPAVARVAVGDVVHAGEVIARVGRDAHCAGACLHWGLTDGVDHFDPLDYVDAGPVVLLPDGSTTAPVRQFAPAVAGVPLGDGARPVSAPVTSRFGMRVHPVTGTYKLHDGSDFGAACGTPVVLPWAGTVVATERHRAYGNRVIVEHAGLRTAYAHLMGLEVVRGQQLAAGSVVGHVGNTGWSTGCHLHWMAWRGGTLIDPLTL